MIHTTFVFIFIILQANSQIFIDYGVGGQGKQLFKYFYDIQDSFYVDIGAYDPIFASNTLNLYTQGWGGINVDASPERLNKFFIERPDQTNLNFAVGQQNTMLTLYELDEDSSSTVSVKVKDYASTFKPLVKQIKIPSISMKQICQRYYYRKPIFLNLDIEGYGSKALQSNDWNNPKCVPQVIFSQINQQTRISGLPLPQTILVKHGYKKINSQVGLNQVYILSSVYDKYMAKAKQATSLLAKKTILNVNSISYAAAAYLKVRTSLVKHYQPKRDGIHYKFARYDQPIYLDQLNRQSNLWGQVKNRPIVVYHFNPHLSAIFVQNGNFTSKEIKMNQYNFTQINVTKADNTKYSVYIFNHQFLPKKEPNIIAMAVSNEVVGNKTYEPQKVPAQKSQNKTSFSQKIANQYSIQVEKQKQELSMLNDKFMQQIQVVNSKFDQMTRRQIINLQQIGKKLTNIQVKLSQFNHPSAQHKTSGNQKQIDTPPKSTQKVQPFSNNLASQLANLIVLQQFTMVIIGVMSTILCVTACITRRAPKDQKVYRLATGNQVMGSELSMYSQK